MVERRRALADDLDRLLADRSARVAAPLTVDPETWVDRMATARERVDRFEAVLDPPETGVYLEGRDARGVVHAVLADPPEPVLVSAGSPPETGVYDPQSVRATAAAHALAEREGRSIDHGVVAYPAAGVIRRISVGARRRGRYREVQRTIAAMDGPPARASADAKCESCEFSETCGTPTRSVRSLLGL